MITNKKINYIFLKEIGSWRVKIWKDVHLNNISDIF